VRLSISSTNPSHKMPFSSTYRITWALSRGGQSSHPKSDPRLTLLQNTLVNFAVSYTIIGILMGITGLYSLGFSYGGPVSVVSATQPSFSQAAASPNLDPMKYPVPCPSSSGMTDDRCSCTSLSFEKPLQSSKSHSMMWTLDLLTMHMGMTGWRHRQTQKNLGR
jgi:hypothetical protein